jgi:DNA modification methylase
MRDLDVVWQSVTALTPYARNSRTHSDEQVAQVAASIKEFGWTNPILIDEEGGIIAGHGRLQAAQRLGESDVPTITLTGLTDAQKRAYVIADNKLALNAGWDNDMLAVEIADLIEEGFDLDLTGFDGDEINKLLADSEKIEEGLTDEDAVPEVPDDPVSKLGDVWVLGKHRVVCGDCTDQTAVDLLMDGQMADMVFTDPPYNVDYSGRGKNNLGKIKNDKMSNDQFDEFLADVFASYLSVMKPLAAIYVCHPDGKTKEKVAFELAFEVPFYKSCTIIWVKQSAGMGWQDYRAQHEPILYGWKEGAGKHFFTDDRTKTTVWQIGRDVQKDYVHPTQKPVALVEEAVLNSSKGHDIVLDFFGGSGSTLIAAEKSARDARIMELDEKFVDVIVRRWQDFTGKDAVHEASGQTFSELSNGKTSQDEQ